MKMKLKSFHVSQLITTIVPIVEFIKKTINFKARLSLFLKDSIESYLNSLMQITFFQSYFF